MQSLVSGADFVSRRLACWVRITMSKARTMPDTLDRRSVLLGGAELGSFRYSATETAYGGDESRER
jgi:hypothetical protein